MRLCREQEGKVDIANMARPLDMLKVAESQYAKVVKSKDACLLRGHFNQRKKRSKWTDIRLRKAINYAINRDELLRYAAKGNAYNLEGFPIPPVAFGYSSDFTPYTYDTSKAKSLIAEAGYSNGFEVKIVAAEPWKLETQILGRMLERIGLEVRVEILESPEWLRRLYIPIMNKSPEEQDWDILIQWNYDWGGHTIASFLPWGYVEDSRMRWIEYDPVYEQMWKEASRAVDAKTQKEKIRVTAGYLYDNAYALFIYSPLMLYAVNREVDFVPQKYYYLRLKETSVTENHWSLRGKNN
jgi:ABC-type transport system substrate-binding protein